MPPELKNLMLRYCQLGQLLPPPDDISSIAEFSLSERAELELVLAELAKVKAAIDAYLGPPPSASAK
jgi:hypothetical protein